MKYTKFFALFISISFCFNQSQIAQFSFSLKDSLRGALRPERNYNVLHYDLSIQLDIPAQSLKGFVGMEFQANQDLSTIQLDLFENMNIKKITYRGRELKFNRKFDAVFVPLNIQKNDQEVLKIYFDGKPIIAKRAPWDGGFVWKQDAQGKPWIGVACEGIGASLWWPNKDHLSDEPEKGMNIHITVPNDLMAISNGNLEKVTDEDKKNKTYHWKVSYPINNYNVSLYVGDYIHFKDQYKAADGSILPLDYYVLKGKEDTARNHFEQVKKMLEAYEFYFDKYPFWNDGYALVESPYLGMEHQSAIAYGNQYKRGYLGARMSAEFNFDYIIIHESGHEYFGNSVSCNDHADMWIHEGFTTYMEALYVEYLHGKKAALRYLESQRSGIQNKMALIGPRDVNFQNFPDSDIYGKGSWVLQTLRFTLKNDSLWFKMIKGFYNTYKYKNINSEDFFMYVNDYTKKDFTPFFNQYFKTNEIPKVKLKILSDTNRTRILFKIECKEEKLELPIEVNIDGRIIQLDASTKERNIEFSKNFKSIKAINTQALVEILPNEEGTFIK
ncbi:MAG: M1 family metallopeptidase [Saprospiraceae bacterium]|nr:M1 family metallopeptidase [Saprospiraceae bacterium]